MKKYSIIAALVIVALIIIISFVIRKPGNEPDFLITKYAPNSLAFFICRSEGVKDGNTCSICENLYQAAYDRREELKITNDLDLINYIKSQDKDCVSNVLGGN